MARAAIGWLATGVTCAMSLSGCIAEAERGSLPAWSFAPDGYFSDTSFAESYYGADLVLIHNRGSFGGEISALDARDGALRWQRSAGWMVHPPGGLDPLWIVDDPPNEDHAQIIRLDARTGSELGRVTLDRPLSTLHSRLVWADGLILAFEYGELRAVDPVGGTTRWTIPLADDYYLFPPLVRGRTVVLQAPTYVAIDARTGAELWRHAGECCTALASPDGRELYLRQAVDAGVRLDARGRERGRLAGEIRAVSDRWVAVEEKGRLAVYRHGAGQPSWTLPTSDKAGVTAVALAGDALFYFSTGDDTLWRYDLAHRRSSAIRTAHGRLVLGTDASGMAPAFIGTAPIFAAPHLFVLDWAVHAYRLPP